MRTHARLMPSKPDCWELLQLEVALHLQTVIFSDWDIAQKGHSGLTGKLSRNRVRAWVY